MIHRGRFTWQELLLLLRDEPLLPSHPRVYVGGDIRTTDTSMTVVAMMLQPGALPMIDPTQPVC
jgi:hypothetical protein|eukprot:COSAG06_NODE_2516_length_6733_cov_25.155261_1_plen_64_part_00